MVSALPELEEQAPESREGMMQTMLHGDGKNRWLDKCFQLIVTGHGRVGINWEHAWGDGVSVVRYEQLSSTKMQYTDAELAVIDTLVCSLADAYLGTRRSMYSWNILEERVVHGKAPSTGALMGLPRSARRRV